MADVQLVVVDGPNSGREFELSGSMVVGRDQSAGLVIDDAESSRRHASLSLEGSTVTVEDLGSTNGTFVNGARISAPRELADGDKVRIGTTVFELRAPHAAPAEPDVSDQATRMGTALPDLDELQVTAPRQVPDFAKEPEPPAAQASEPPAPEPPAPEPVAPEPIQPTAAGIPQPPAPTNAPPPTSGPPGGAGGPPGGGAGAPPPPGGPPPPAAGPPPPAASPPPPPIASSPPPAPGFPPPGASAPPPGPPPGFPPPAPAYAPLAARPPGAPPQGELSGWWRRVGAALIDGVITILLFITIVGPFIYGALTMKREGPNNGQTLGKQALGIRVVRDDGQPFTFGSAMMREIVIKGLLFSVAGNLTFGLAPLLNLLWPLWDETNQALHDKVATTHVVRA